MTNQRIPCPTDASYKAAVLIREVGPLHRKGLFAHCLFTGSPERQNITLDRAIESGWLEETRAGVVLGITARTHFGALDRAAKPYIGQVAPARTPESVFDRPALSKRFIPNSKGLRLDVPAFSVRDGARYRSLAGGAA